MARFTVAMIKHQDQKQLGEQRVYFTHRSMQQFFIKSTEGRNSDMESGDDTEAMEECHLLANFPGLVQAAFLENPRPPAQEWHHLEWAETSSMSH